MRSMLFVPGDRPERFAKAAQSGADAVILDLEDAVSPDHKALARANLSKHDIRGLPVIVRINACDSPCFDEDLAALGSVPFSAIMLPKTNGAISRPRARSAFAVTSGPTPDGSPRLMAMRGGTEEPG